MGFGWNLSELLGNTCYCIIDPSTDVGMATLVDRSVVFPCSYEQFLRVYCTDVQNCVY